MTAPSPLRLLLWLKWTLTWRGYRQNRMKVLGTIVLLLVFVPLSGGVAAGLWFLSTRFPTLAAPLARDTLAVIYGLWIITPLLGFPLNEAFDLTRLFVYPLTFRQIFGGSVLGSLIDLPVLLALPTLVVLLMLFSHSPGAWVVNTLLLLLFLLHTLALGQAITLALIGFLRSRRFRDITIVLFPLLGMAYYVGQRVFVAQLRTFSLSRWVDAPLWQAAHWLPPGWASLGLGLAAQQHWASAWLMLGLLGAATLATLAAAGFLLQALYLGDAGPGIAQQVPVPSAASRPAQTPVRVSALAAPLARALPPAALAMMGKEWTYLQREPQYKAMAVNVLYTLAVIGLPFLLPLSGRSNAYGHLSFLGEWLLFGVAGTLLLALLPLLFNIFGGEGAAVTVLFSFPTRRRDILLGKNGAHGAVLLLVTALGLSVAAALTHEWRAWPAAYALVLLCAPVLLAVGNLVSIRLPHRVLVRGQRWSRGGIASASGGLGEGCGYAFLYLAAYLGAFVATLPCVAAALLPGRFGIALGWYGLTLPLAFVYALVLYRVLLGQAETWLLSREPEIAGRIVPEL